MEKLQNVTEPTLMFLNTMVGTGKTVMSVALAQFLQTLKNQALDQKGNLKGVYEGDNFLFKSDLSKLQVGLGIV